MNMKCKKNDLFLTFVIKAQTISSMARQFDPSLSKKKKQLQVNLTFKVRP